MSHSQARAIAQIKRLCCLDLGREAIAPALARALLQLIPGFSASFFFTDEKCQLLNIYDENPALLEVGPLYVNEFYNSRETETWIELGEVFRRGFVGMTLRHILKVDGWSWERSDMYNLIVRPLGYHHSIRLAVRARGRPSGIVVVSRGINEPEFTERDLSLLVSLEPYFSHAFESSHQSVPSVESDALEDQGLVIADREGQIQYLSRQARALLFYATHDEIAPGKMRTRRSELPAAVEQIARRLAQVFEGDPPATPPVHYHRNGWGEFVFRAFWLDGQDAKPPLVGIRINRREPLPVRLLRRMEHLPLSERQIEVSLHLASGQTYAAIAERLGISRPTVIYHAQEVFNKLGVTGRAELQAKFMSL